MYVLELYVTNASLHVDRPFTYVSTKEVGVFCRVKIAFHKSITTGLVYRSRYYEGDQKALESELGFKVNEIVDVIDDEPILSKEQFELALWLSKTTVSPLVSCLNTMLPKALRTSKKIEPPRLKEFLKKKEAPLTLTKRQIEVFDLLYDGMEAKDARAISPSIIKKLKEMDAISFYRKEKRYINEIPLNAVAFKELTLEQKLVYDGLLNSDKMVSLLFGVTGSGKTEVYLHLARHYLSLGKEVLILVPEISLTPQMIQRVKERFLDVIFYHSELSDQEKYEQYVRVKEKEANIVVGTRSSVFLPFHDLGLIIVDEEHDSSYKQDNVPCYSVKNVAIKKAMMHNARVLLASATPSLESYSRALKGDYGFLKLLHRINDVPLSIEVVDLSKEIKSHSSYILSKKLLYEMETTLQRKKQVIILLNRRGYAPVIRCGSCNTTLMCQDCDIPLSYHKDEGILKCHQCGRIYQMPKRCPSCGEPELVYYGFGTKRVEEEVKKLFPDARVERMDRDNTMRKGSHKEILDRFEQGEIDILIGTQMIAKGLDYPKVELVGILNADAGLMHQDYNAAKMTFDLLMQASGRSGRSYDTGKVIIQAFNVDHYVLKAVLKQDYHYFYNIEMKYRERAKYPPYTHIVAFYLQDHDVHRLTSSLEQLEEDLRILPYRIYPHSALLKLKKEERYRILMMDKDLLSMLKDVQGIVSKYINTRNRSRLKVDIDPLYLE